MKKRTSLKNRVTLFAFWLSAAMLFLMDAVFISLAFSFLPREDALFFTALALGITLGLLLLSLLLPLQCDFRRLLCDGLLRQAVLPVLPAS